MNTMKSDNETAGNSESSPSDSTVIEDVVLRPSSGLSPSQRELRSKVYPPVGEQDTAEQPLQYPLKGLLLLTLAVAIGFAGHQWVSAKIFAGLLGIVANILVFSSELSPTEEKSANAIGMFVCVALGAALIVALFAS